MRLKASEYSLDPAMKMDLNAIIEKMETGDQDAALIALQTYNKEVKYDC